MKVAFLLLFLSTQLPLAALDHSKIHKGLTREQSAKVIPRDYRYNVLSDQTLRRHWSEEGHEYALDFDPKDGKLLCARIRYDEPVSLKVATRDMQKIGRTHASGWKRGEAKKMRHIGFTKARYIKLDDKTFFFASQNRSGKVTALYFFTSTPKSDRYALAEGSSSTHQTALGSSDSSAAKRIAYLQREEEQLRAQAGGAAIAAVATPSPSKAGSLSPKAAGATSPATNADSELTDQLMNPEQQGGIINMGMLFAIVGGVLVIALLYKLCFSSAPKRRR